MEQQDLGGATAEGVAAAAGMGGQRRGWTDSECVSSELTTAAPAAEAATAAATTRVKRARARARGVRGSGRCGVGDGCQGVSGAMGDGRQATGCNRASPSLQAPILLRPCVPMASTPCTRHPGHGPKTSLVFNIADLRA